MKINVINPNTSKQMTRLIGDIVNKFASHDTIVEVVSPTDGPISIESHLDDAIAAASILELVAVGEQQRADGQVIACFGDPGLLAAREISSGPVVGIAEAAMHAATLVATRFSIVTSMARTAIQSEELLVRYGFERHCRNIRSVNVPVLGIAQNGCDIVDLITHECYRSRDEDNIGAIVLGCSALGLHAERLTIELGIPVIDGVRTAICLIEAMVKSGLKTSKHGDLARPTKKEFSGRYSVWNSML
ncbi:aspartate/glutamate racemase family protein [Acidithiobacillus sp. IBUN Pt1247-S3]|uniref:aspartate/glutamate racemase family protein n=1 Tax=Acidithiobacillus sp. IBUN Pt1247-S3 TaxID=3166642 RepID=UPI0034E541BC